MRYLILAIIILIPVQSGNAFKLIELLRMVEEMGLLNPQVTPTPTPTEIDVSLPTSTPTVTPVPATSTPTPLPFSPLEIAVYDSKNDRTPVSGTDMDFSEDKKLYVEWGDPMKQLPADYTITDFHVYANVNGEAKFLGSTAANVREFEFSPEFGKDYDFYVYALFDEHSDKVNLVIATASEPIQYREAVDNAPVFSTIDKVTLDEDSPNLSSIINVSNYVSDEDKGSLRYSVSSTNPNVIPEIDSDGNVSAYAPNVHGSQFLHITATDSRGQKGETAVEFELNAKPDANVSLENMVDPTEALTGSIEMYAYKIGNPNKTYTAQQDVNGNFSMQFDGPGEYAVVTMGDNIHTRVQKISVPDTNDVEHTANPVPGYVDGEFVKDILMREGRVVKPQNGNTFGTYAFFRFPGDSDNDVRFAYDNVIRPIVRTLSGGQRDILLDLNGDHVGNPDYLQIWTSPPDPNTTDVGVFLYASYPSTSQTIPDGQNTITRGTAEFWKDHAGYGLQEGYGMHIGGGESNKLTSVFSDPISSDHLMPQDEYALKIWQKMTPGSTIVKEQTGLKYMFLDKGL